jgi:hypothetical protein
MIERVHNSMLVSAEFLPYWEECLDDRSKIGGEMHQFTVLFTACTDDLPEAESLALYRDVTAQDDSDECTVDTSLVISRSKAKQLKIKPTCDHDAFGICKQMISSGLKICKVDYCETCPEAHSCNMTCGLPCAGGDGIGHRRWLAELSSWDSELTELSALCPLEGFHGRLREINELCCPGDGSCSDGMPTSCPYACGRQWTTFYEACLPLLARLFPDAENFSRLTR